MGISIAHPSATIWARNASARVSRVRIGIRIASRPEICRGEGGILACLFNQPASSGFWAISRHQTVMGTRKVSSAVYSHRREVMPSFPQHWGDHGGSQQKHSAAHRQWHMRATMRSYTWIQEPKVASSISTLKMNLGRSILLSTPMRRRGMATSKGEREVLGFYSRLHKLIINAAHDRLPPSAWWSSLVYAVLAGVSLVYGGVRSFVEACYTLGILKAKRLPLPVISVGNITWGGTGKTPMVVLLAQMIVQRGGKALVLTRGYGRDEDAMLRAILEGEALVASGSDRFSAATATLAGPGGDEVTCVILDDGLQHHRLQRDVHVVMVNCVEPWGSGRLLPRGPLRQSLEEGIKATDLLVLHNADMATAEQVDAITSRLRPTLRGDAGIAHSRFAPSRLAPISEVLEGVEGGGVQVEKGKGVYVFAGLGCTEAFFKTVAAAAGGGTILKEVAFPDHYAYTDQELASMAREAHELTMEASPHCDGYVVVTSEKDAFRSGHAIRDTFLGAGCEAVLVVRGGLEIMHWGESGSDAFERVLKVALGNGQLL